MFYKRINVLFMNETAAESVFFSAAHTDAHLTGI